jgi:hypothetical protein
MEDQKELMDYVFEINSMTTKEFCEYAGTPVPKWTGSSQVAVMDFLSIDAIKWRLVKEKAQEIARRKTE